MIARRVFRLAVATVLAAPLIGWGVGTASASTATTSFPCSDSGTGSTLPAAVGLAKQNLIGDYTVLSGIALAYDKQEADGSWYAVVSARCGEPR